MSFLTPGVYGHHYGVPMVWRSPVKKRVPPSVLDKLAELDDEPPPYSSRKALSSPPDPDPSDSQSSEDEYPPNRRSARRRRRHRPRRESDTSSAEPTEERPGPGWFNRPIHFRIPHVVRSFIHWVAARLLLPSEVIDLGFYVVENALTHLMRRRAKFMREHPEIAFAPPWKQQRWLQGDVRGDEWDEYRLARYPWWEREAAKKAMKRGEVYVWPRPDEDGGPCLISDE